MFLNSCDLETAQNTVFENLSLFEQIANNVIEENGFEYKAKASLGISEFSTRYYDDFTLPAGDYQSLIITLGEGKGKNWWCVVFPTLCFSATAEELDAVAAGSGFSDSLTGAITGKEEYEVRFYFLDLLGKLENFVTR